MTRFDYEDENAPNRLVKVVLILWKDAYDDHEIMTLDTAARQLKNGMPMFTSGVLVDEDDGDSVVVAQDFITCYPMVRNIRKIPKVNIVDMWEVDYKWDEGLIEEGDVLVDANPKILACVMSQ